MIVELDELVPSMAVDLNERNLRNWLLRGCIWKPQESTSIFALYPAYKEFCWNDCQQSPMEMTFFCKYLRGWGYAVGDQTIAGIALRAATVAPASAPKPAVAIPPKLPGGNAALSTPRELAIMPGDDAETVAQKQAYNESLRPKPKPEVVFTSAKPSM